MSQDSEEASFPFVGCEELSCNGTGVGVSPGTLENVLFFFPFHSDEVDDFSSYIPALLFNLKQNAMKAFKFLP